MSSQEAIDIELERLKCWDCGERFILKVEEQKFFKLKGYEPPKRCPACRERKSLMRMGIDPDLL
jgi:DNA-directed RNA polymerase subunit RPC12/RpoP